jgi:hypothetical protein
VSIYLTLSSLSTGPEQPARCLCGAYAPIYEGLAYFDCAACGQRWWALAPGLMLQQLEKARRAISTA